VVREGIFKGEEYSSQCKSLGARVSKQPLAGIRQSKSGGQVREVAGRVVQALPTTRRALGRLLEL
jgi:hypothetical protein